MTCQTQSPIIPASNISRGQPLVSGETATNEPATGPRNEREPFDAQEYLSRGLALHLGGKPQAALIEYQRSLDMNEENPYAHYLTGLALMALGCDQQAHDEWRNAEALRPQDEQGAWAIRMARRLLDHGQ